MKKRLTTIFLWGAMTAGAMANTPTAEISHQEKIETILAADREAWTVSDLETLKTELKALRAADWEGMTSSERKALKKELREVKREVKASKELDCGVYLSATALIVILLVLIIIL